MQNIAYTYINNNIFMFSIFFYLRRLEKYEKDNNDSTYLNATCFGIGIFYV